MCAGALGSPNKALCGTSNTEWRFAGGWHCQRLRQPSWCCWAPVPKAQAAFGSMPGDSTTGAPDWRDAAKLRKFLADDIPQWTPSEGAENTRAFLAALREKCSTEIGAMTGLLLALFEERVDASKAGFELAQKLKRGGGGATPREELDMEMLFGDTEDFESAASAEVKIEQVDWTPELEAKWRAQVKGVLKLITHMVVSNTNPKIRDSLSVEL